MHNLIYNGNSLNDLGFAIKDRPFYKVASRDIEFQKVCGGDGDIIVDNDNYNNVEVEYNINTLSFLSPEKDPQIIAQKVIDSFFYSNGKYNVLRDTYNVGYFTHAICVSPSDLKQIGKYHFETVLKFSRKPYWYSDIGQETLCFNSHSLVLYNPEKYTAKPYIKVIGTGAFTLKINSIEIYISKCTDYIEIDCEKYNVKKGKVNKNDVVQGDYLPFFKAGENYITLTPDNEDNSFSLEITPNWRRL